MAKLIIGKKEELEKEVRFWLEVAENDGIYLKADAGENEQVLLSIASDGDMTSSLLSCPKLIEFFNGSYRPLSGI